MLVSRRISLVSAGVLVSLLLSASALAAPVTVNLRVEGSSSTLFEGPVTTQGETISTTSSGGPHPCNYSENGPSSEKGTPENENGGHASGTPTTALHDATVASGLAFDASWFGSGVSKNGNPGDFFVSRVGSDANEKSSPFDSWGYAVNYTTAPVGGCQVALAPGSEVLWAYNYFNLTHLLSLSGPASATAGMPFTVHVADGQTGEPLAGASIGQLASGVVGTGPSSPTTDAAGNATVDVPQAGTTTLKAIRGDSVRSNGLSVCVHNGDDGSCGTTQLITCALSSAGGCPGLPHIPIVSPSLPDVAKVGGVKNGHVYSRRLAPRVLGGVVEVPLGGTLRQVRIRLERRYRHHCFDFDGPRARFLRVKKCGSASFFSVGGSESFSYLLPRRLAPGRYIYEIEAVDGAGHVTKLVPGVSHVVFQVK